jgi:hypothetical protein
LAKTVPKKRLMWERVSATSCPDWGATVPKTRATVPKMVPNRSRNGPTSFPTGVCGNAFQSKGHLRMRILALRLHPNDPHYIPVTPDNPKALLTISRRRGSRLRCMHGVLGQCQGAKAQDSTASTACTACSVMCHLLLAALFSDKLLHSKTPAAKECAGSLQGRVCRQSPLMDWLPG